MVPLLSDWTCSVVPEGQGNPFNVVERLRATGISGIEYIVVHSARKGRKRGGWRLVYSEGPGHVCLSGLSDTPDIPKRLAEEAEAKIQERHDKLRQGQTYPVEPRRTP